MTMTASIKLPIGKKYFISYSNIVLMILGLIFIISFFVSVIMFNKSNSYYNFSKWIYSFIIEIKNCGNFSTIFLKSFAFIFAFIFTAFILGLCPIGCFFIPIIILLLGIIYGFFTSFLYSSLGIAGMGLNALSCCPFIVFFVVILLLSSRESLGLSGVFLKNMMPNVTPVNLFDNFKTYALRYLFITLLMLIASLINAVTCTLFISYFKI